MEVTNLKEKLQFNEILEKILEFSYAEPNVDNILKLNPFDNIFDANQEIDEIKSFYNLLKETSFPQLIIKDMSNIFLMLKKEGGFLQPTDFLSILSLLKLSSEVKQIIENLDDNFFQIKIKYQNKLHSFKYLENIIPNTFDENGNFLDSASQELKSIRSKIRDTRNLILDKLNEFLFSGYFTNFIQETIITIRNNRYVIPLKPNFGQKIKGIIQDYSASKNSVYVEPDFIVNLNNKLSYLQQEEYKEQIRILTELTEIVKNNFYEIDESYNTLIKIDFKLAKTKFGKQFNFIPVELNEEDINIINANNPILAINKKYVVPIDIVFNDKKILIITGANTGGKTVAIKTLGLINLMAQCGLPVPVNEESKIKFFDKIFIDIGDSQDLSTDLSTFSAHINNINSFLDKCDNNTLVLIDELGTGTDPKDGAALGRALIEFFLKKSSFAVITTHIEDLKYLNYIYDKVENVSVAFNENSIKPEYRLIYGVSGRSYAIKIAEKLNFNKEVIKLSKQFYDETSSEFLKKLIDIENLKKELIEKERNIYLEKQKLSIEKEKYRRLKEKLSLEKEKIKELVKEKYQKKLDKLIDKFDRFVKSSRSELTAKEYAKLMENKKKILKELEKEIFVQNDKKIEANGYNLSDFYIGIAVKHLKTGAKGRVLSIDTNEKKLEILFENNLKLMLHFKEIVPVELSEKQETYSINTDYENKLFTLNLVGKRVDEAILELKKHIDYAILKGADKIEIIHGLGTGRLKRGLSEYLKSCHYIKDFYSPIEKTGGLGITIVELK